MMSKSKGLMSAALVVALAVGTGPAFAKPDSDDVAGAMVLLGLAALSHHEHHYRDGQGPSDAQSTADFERGYRDALHGYDYDSARSSSWYSQGFDAGHQERLSRTTHRHRTSPDESKVSAFNLQSCADTVAARMNVGSHHVHVTRSVVRGPNDYLVEVAVGHKYLVCAMGDNGQMNDVSEGRIQ